MWKKERRLVDGWPGSGVLWSVRTHWRAPELVCHLYMWGQISSWAPGFYDPPNSSEVMGPCLLFSITATKCTRESKLRKKGLPWLKSSVPSLWARGKAECKGSGSVCYLPLMWHVTSHTRLLQSVVSPRSMGHLSQRSPPHSVTVYTGALTYLWLLCAPIPGRVGVFASYLHFRRAEINQQLSDSVSFGVGYRVY